MKNYYEILEVNENASFEVIEQAYKALVKKYHPDTHSQEKNAWAESEFKKIQEAYFVLSDPKLRVEYNLKLGIGSNVLKQYNSLYEQNQKLQQEIDSLKEEKESSRKGFFGKKKNKNGMFSNSVINDLPSIKELLKRFGTALYNETKKPKEERSKDLLAFVLTIIIVGLIVFAFIKIPILYRIIFPEL